METGFGPVVLDLSQGVQVVCHSEKGEIIPFIGEVIKAEAPSKVSWMLPDGCVFVMTAPVQRGLRISATDGLTVSCQHGFSVTYFEA